MGWQSPFRSDEDTPTAIDVLANDHDTDNLVPPDNAGLDSGPSVTAGAMERSPDNGPDVTYIPSANYFGLDWLHYQAPDGVLTSNLASGYNPEFNHRRRTPRRPRYIRHFSQIRRSVTRWMS